MGIFVKVWRQVPFMFCQNMCSTIAVCNMLKWRYGFILFGTCITPSLSSRIYGGRVVLPTDKMKFPYHLQLVINMSNWWFCGASLIAPR